MCYKTSSLRAPSVMFEISHGCYCFKGPSLARQEPSARSCEREVAELALFAVYYVYKPQVVISGWRTVITVQLLCNYTHITLLFHL